MLIQIILILCWVHSSQRSDNDCYTAKQKAEHVIADFLNDLNDKHFGKAF